MPKFEQVNPKPNFPEMEENINAFWKKAKIFEKSVKQRLKNDLYVFYDGPPFISGLPHYGHLLGSIAKDVIPRYWTMKGKRVERVWGWDAHGLTVENKVQKKLGIKERKDIEKFGLEKFTQECYKYTSETSAEWDWYIDKIGRWVDIKNAYKTIDQNYMESVMWAFKQLYDKDLIYEGVRTSLYCTTCGTPVSNFEIAMDNTYREVEDPAVTIEFPIISAGKFKGVNLLAWTTTPWTLPSNRALVVDPNEIYVEFTNKESKNKYIIAKKRLEHIVKQDPYKIVKEFKGSELLGLEYDPPFKFFKSKKGEFKVYEFKGMVHMEEGTGIVHSAPGFGDIDTKMGQHYGLTIMMTIDDEGKFLPGDKKKNPYEGLYYKRADDAIIRDLGASGLNRLFRNEKITHRFPYHDRCDTNLVHRAQKSWFINIQKIKDNLIKNNKDINWVPSNLKLGRFKKGIEQAPDWCISRTRFWATPMPVWEAKDGDRIVVSSIKELEKLSGQKVKDLHRPYIDEIKIKKNNKIYKRRTEVLDSWMEAGSMPYAQIHYPFENEKKFKDNFPGDYIVEYIAQVRAWFYVMHVLSTALFDTNSFKNVISTGIIAGNDGRKMSKTYQNYTDPKQVLEQIGGEALRLYLMGSPVMTGDNMNWSDRELNDQVKNILIPFWNAYRYFLLYANLNNWEPADESDFNIKSADILDQWLKSYLNKATLKYSKHIEAYNVPASVKLIQPCIDNLSTWWIRRSRKRFAQGDTQAIQTLYAALVQLIKTFAPQMPFLTEEIWLNLIKSNFEDQPESVHLCEYPVIDEKQIDEKLLSQMSLVQKVCSWGLNIRRDQGLRLRQPLSKAFINIKLEDNALSDIVKQELNVQSLKYTEKVKQGKNLIAREEGKTFIVLDTKLSSKLKEEGLINELLRKFQQARKDAGCKLGEQVPKLVYFTKKEELRKIVKKNIEQLKQVVKIDKIVFRENLSQKEYSFDDFDLFVMIER